MTPNEIKARNEAVERIRRNAELNERIRLETLQDLRLLRFVAWFVAFVAFVFILALVIS